MTAPRERALLWALLAGNLVIGTGVLMPAGMMNVLADAFTLTAPQAGRLIWAGAVTMAVGAPLMAQLASPVDRRVLLVGALALYVGGHLVSALCDSFEQLLAARVVTVLGAAIFTPQAAAAVSALLPPERRAAGVTFVFLGWSIASAAGMPIGSWLSSQLGWRAGYLMEMTLALAAAIAVAATMPARVRAPAVSLGTWQAVARSRPLVLALAVTVVQMAGQFALSTYLAPELRRKTGASPATIAAMFGLFGACGVLGSVVVSRLVRHADPSRAVAASLALIALGLLVWSAAGASLALIALAMALWGLGGFATNSLQQARLIGLAPSLAPASVALNSSGLYLGQAAGALAGAALIEASRIDWLAPTGAVLVAAAIGLSRRIRPAGRP